MMQGTFCPCGSIGLLGSVTCRVCRLRIRGISQGVRETCRVSDLGFIGSGVLSPTWTLSDYCFLLRMFRCLFLLSPQKGCAGKSGLHAESYRYTSRH